MTQIIENTLYKPKLKKAQEIITLLNNNSLIIKEVVKKSTKSQKEIEHFFQLEFIKSKAKSSHFTDIYSIISHQLYIMRHFVDQQKLDVILMNEEKYNALVKLLGFLNDCNKMFNDNVEFVKDKLNKKKYSNNEKGKNELLKDLKSIKEMLYYYWLNPFHKISLKVFPFINKTFDHTENLEYNEIEKLLNQALHYTKNWKNFGYTPRKKSKKKSKKSEK